MPRWWHKLFVMAFWTYSMVALFDFVGMAAGGRFGEYRFIFAVVCLCAIACITELSRGLLHPLNAKAMLFPGSPGANIVVAGTKPKWWQKLLALACWLVLVLLLFKTMGSIAGERFAENWLDFSLFILCGVALVVELSKRFLQLGGSKSMLPIEAIETTGPGTSLPAPIAEGSITMSEKANNFFFTPAGITIQSITNHNTEGGIIGNAPIIVNQNFGKQHEEPPTPRDESPEAAPEPVSETDTIDINELLEYAEQRMNRAVSRNTIVNILERAGIEPCGEIKVGKTWCKVYPRARAKEAVDKWATDKMK